MYKKEKDIETEQEFFEKMVMERVAFENMSMERVPFKVNTITIDDIPVGAVTTSNAGVSWASLKDDERLKISREAFNKTKGKTVIDVGLTKDCIYITFEDYGVLHVSPTHSTAIIQEIGYLDKLNGMYLFDIVAEDSSSLIMNGCVYVHLISHIGTRASFRVSDSDKMNPILFDILYQPR